MSDRNPFHIEIGSVEFNQICRVLNDFEESANAHSGFDGMSGGFKFSDEVPKDPSALGPLLEPMICVLRYLWAYRISLVAGNPNASMEPWWIAVRDLAPGWPGFKDARCSAAMLTLAEITNSRSDQLYNDLDELDRKATTRNHGDN